MIRHDLRDFRSALALTQEQMALLLGVNRAHLSRLETGDRKMTGEQTIRFNVLRQLAREPLLAAAMKRAGSSA